MVKGMGWSGLSIKESRVEDVIILVHVLYTLATPDTKTGAVVQAQKDES
jgi:hypothetical protein